MKKYVLTFLFTSDYKNVWLIEKNRPNWQKGSLNGIGGKIEKISIIQKEKKNLMPIQNKQNT